MDQKQGTRSKKRMIIKSCFCLWKFTDERSKTRVNSTIQEQYTWTWRSKKSQCICIYTKL